jgi:hypothetical protein
MPIRKTLGPVPIATIAEEGFEMAEKAATLDCSDGILEQGFAGPLKKGGKCAMGHSGANSELTRDFFVVSGIRSR